MSNFWGAVQRFRRPFLRPAVLVALRKNPE
nr:MAG TPA: hypothetical protein [Caudoviricetes sp.]